MGKLSGIILIQIIVQIEIIAANPNGWKNPKVKE